MERPAFVKVWATALVFDLLFLFGLLLSAHTALLGLLFYAPFQFCKALPQSLEWLEHRSPEGGRWSALARAVCGSGLLFLVTGVIYIAVGPPEESSLTAILAWLYLTLWLLRFYFASMFNALCAVACLVMGKASLTRLNAFSGLATSAAGIYLYRDIASRPHQMMNSLASLGVQSTGAVETLILVSFVLLSFGACLVSGAMLHWLAVKWHE